MEKEQTRIEQLVEFLPKTSLCFISIGNVVAIPFGEITHISKYDNETVIYAGTNSYRTHHNLQEIMNDLPVNDFFRIHKSHVISLRYMNGVKRKRIRVGEYYLSLSNYYKVQLIRRLGERLEKEYEFFTSPK